jgi:BirA family biotin operon repressor/biotin-[acetyl-CoA-carboxylase] ligase
MKLPSAARTALMMPQSRWTLVTRHLGWEVRVFDEVDSTNTQALALASDSSLHGLVILAKSQSAGRGQYGRTWTAPPGSSVLMSLLVFPPEPLRKPAVMIAWAAVSVCDVIAQLTGLRATIKWPNDILIGGKKVCGFLIEQRTTGIDSAPLATVVGLGLNVSQPADTFAFANLPDAASLASLTGKLHAIDGVARAIIHRMDEEYGRLLSGNLSSLESLWQWRLGLVGKPVVVETTDDLFRGQLLDIAFAGVTLKTEGSVVRLAPESIRHVRVEESAT